VGGAECSAPPAGMIGRKGTYLTRRRWLCRRAMNLENPTVRLADIIGLQRPPPDSACLRRGWSAQVRRRLALSSVPAALATDNRYVTLNGGVGSAYRVYLHRSLLLHLHPTHNDIIRCRCKDFVFCIGSSQHVGLLGDNTHLSAWKRWFHSPDHFGPSTCCPPNQLTLGASPASTPSLGPS